MLVQSDRTLRSELLVIDYGNRISEQISINGLNKVFEAVYVKKIKSTSNKSIKRYIQNAIFLVRKDTFDLKKTNRYDKVYISGTEMNSKIVALYYVKKGASLFYLEDGLASYDLVLKKETKYKQDTVLKLMYGYRALDVCQGLYVHVPKCVMDNSNDVPLFTIPQIDNDFDMLSLCDSFISEGTTFHHKYVFLNAWFENEDMYKEQMRYIQILKKKRGQEYCIKKHPNEMNNNPSEEYIYEDCGNFELANCMYDMSDKLMISIISTACLTPYFLLNKSMKVIFLYKIFLRKYVMEEWKRIDNVIRKMIHEYGLQNLVFIPESIDEYVSLLEML